MTTLEYRDSLRGRIRGTEERIKQLTEQMADLGRNRKDYDHMPELYEWLKAYVREQLNDNKHQLKQCVEEMQYSNQGLNPPYLYFR